MDQLDENLRELKRRVDARVEQMLIVRRAQGAETQTLVTSHDGSPQPFEQHSDFEHDAYVRPALPLPHGDDPMVVHPNMGLNRSNPDPIANFSQPQEEDKTLRAAERIAEQSVGQDLDTFVDTDAGSMAPHNHILAHPPAIRRRSLLHKLFGRFLSVRA